jgi:hypothetical protein
VLGEDPPLVGFAQQAVADLAGAKFIPAFRDGDATDCDTRMDIYYKVD